MSLHPRDPYCYLMKLSGNGANCMKTYIHSIAGRLRIRAERITSDAGLQGELRKLPGVSGVELRTASSSLVIRYDASSRAGEEILFLLDKRGYLDEEFETNVKPPKVAKAKSNDDLGSRLVSHVKQAAVASVTSYLIEAAIVRFGPPGAKLLLPLVRGARSAISG